jgi:hypothetical protein
MKRLHNRAYPTLEQCERRALLSGGIALPATAAMVTPIPIEKAVQLDGTFRGKYHRHDKIPDAGTTFDLTGSGHVSGVGQGFVTGHIHTLGLIAQGHAQGKLFLSGVGGTITLKLTGPEQDNGPDGLPDYLHYKVVGGTGKYQNVTDSGVASLVVIPGHSSQHRGDPDHGTFTLVLTSS